MRHSLNIGIGTTLVAAAAMLTLAGCNSKPAPTTTASTADTKPKLGIRPYGDETVKINMDLVPADLKKTFDYIDAHIDEHVENLQRWVQQPSISNSGEGIPETAEMVKGMLDKLGCVDTKIYDVGVAEWGQPGNPVVYGKLDEGQPKTLLIYWMYDTMPVTQPDNWVAPPFEARIVDGATAGLDPAIKKVLVGRGATNSKGGEMATYNAIASMKATMGKLPVNLIFIAEGDEERMSMGLRKFVTTHRDLVEVADAMLGGGTSEGLMYIELTTSGKAWQRGPTVSDIHGSFKRSVDSPAWRHIQMLSSLTAKDGNSTKIEGWGNDIAPLSPSETKMVEEAGKHADLKQMAQNAGIARFISDDPATVTMMARHGTAWNLDGIWGGNMYAGGSGAILPNKITSKHSIRYVPNMHSADIVKKIRAQLDKNGYQDVKLTLVGDQPWSKMKFDSDIAEASRKTAAIFGRPGRERPDAASILMDNASMSGANPSYLFTNNDQGDPNVKPIGLPIANFSVGSGGRAHAANEYYVIEGAGRTWGYAAAEKSVAAMIYNYSKITTVAPKNGKSIELPMQNVATK
jgi:acetylornithine deacetylase/succinyl-diaminopimelate desuccinylase-like protein